MNLLTLPLPELSALTCHEHLVCFCNFVGIDPGEISSDVSGSSDDRITVEVLESDDDAYGLTLRVNQVTVYHRDELKGLNMEDLKQYIHLHAGMFDMRVKQGMSELGKDRLRAEILELDENIQLLSRYCGLLRIQREPTMQKACSQADIARISEILPQMTRILRERVEGFSPNLSLGRYKELLRALQEQKTQKSHLLAPSASPDSLVDRTIQSFEKAMS